MSWGTWSLGTPMSSAHRLLMGRVAELEQVPKALRAAGMTLVKNSTTQKNLIPANPAAAFANGDMLQVLVFAVIVGITCLALGKKAEPFVTLAYSINEISVKIVSVVMLFTPVGVLCSIASVVYANGTETILALGTVLIALYLTFFLYAFIVYGGIVKLLGRYGVVEFFTKVMPAADCAPILPVADTLPMPWMPATREQNTRG